MTRNERIKASAYLLEMSPESLREKLDFNLEGFKEQRVERLFKIKEVAEMWNCSVKHIWNMIKKGEINVTRTIGITRIARSELDRITSQED